MKIVCISDTHGQHDELNLPSGDVLVHAGDFSKFSRWTDVENFLNWFSRQPHKHKLFIAGNHDRPFEETPAKARASIPWGVTYLQDSGIMIDGVYFYGSPWQPRFFDWAFNLDRGEEIAKKWAKIPDDVNVLITHGPPFEMLDVSRFTSSRMGCEDLRQRIEQLSHLKANIFGHNHGGYGWKEVNGVQYVNAAMCDEEYNITHAPIVIDIEVK